MGDANASDVAILESMNLAIPQWEQRRDESAIAELGAVLSDDLIFRRADGSVVDKPQFLKALAGPSPFVSRTSEDVAVHIRGDHALATSIVVTSSADGAVSRFQNARMFTARDRRWQLTVWFNTKVP